MAHGSPCMWGSRLAVPICGGGVDDVRALVDAMHKRLGVLFPMDDFFLNVLGAGWLAGRLPRHLFHLGGRGRHARVVILGSYKIRQPHIDALEDLKANGESNSLKYLASLTREIDQQKVRDCVDVLAPEVRGGTWCWRGGSEDNYEALMQEHRAWAHLGATPRDLNDDLADARRALTNLEEKHGGADPKKWRWGEGTPCTDVFAADEAKRKHEDLIERVAALQRICDGAAGSAAGSGAASSGNRERSRSPRGAPSAPAGERAAEQ